MVQRTFYVQKQTKTRRHVDSNTREHQKKTQLWGTCAKQTLGRDKHFHNIKCLMNMEQLW